MLLSFNSLGSSVWMSFWKTSCCTAFILSLFWFLGEPGTMSALFKSFICSLWCLLWDWAWNTRIGSGMEDTGGKSYNNPNHISTTSFQKHTLPYSTIIFCPLIYRKSPFIPSMLFINCSSMCTWLVSMAPRVAPAGRFCNYIILF